MARIESADPQVIATVNIYDPEQGKQHVEIYLRMEQGPEGARFGLGIDGSASMKENFAAHIPPIFRKPEQNVMQPVVQRLCSFLRGFAADDCVDLIYWAVGKAGGEIEPVGRIDEAGETALKVEGPKVKNWGPGTKLAPPLKYYADAFKDAKWSMVVFVTDGKIEDIDDVKALSLEMGREYEKKQRGYFKFVIVGVGKEIDEEQMEELNDLFEGKGIHDPVTGEELDPWDARSAATMQSLWDVMGEVDFGITLPGFARISDDRGAEVLSYSDEIPMKLDFEVRAGTKSVNIEIAGQTITQPLA